MTLTSINWKHRARDFCKEHGSLEVATVEKALREGAAIAVQCTTEKLGNVRERLEAMRIKSNAPQ